MSTNYYARVIPTKKKKKELHDAIDANNISMVQTLVHELYDSIYMDWSCDEIKGGCIHLGKRSAGWKFLWNPNIFQVRNGHLVKIKDKNGEGSMWISDPDTPKYLYPLTKEGIKAFIDKEDIEIYDEYGEKQDKEEFWNMAINWTTWKDPKTGEVKEAWDSDTYEAEYPNTFRLSCKNEYTDFLESLGYKLSDSGSDFYSDGLRFSTSTDFS